MNIGLGIRFPYWIMILAKYYSYYNCIYQISLYQWKAKQYVEISLKFDVNLAMKLNLI